MWLGHDLAHAAHSLETDDCETGRRRLERVEIRNALVVAVVVQIAHAGALTALLDGLVVLVRANERVFALAGVLAKQRLEFLRVRLDREGRPNAVRIDIVLDADVGLARNVLDDLGRNRKLRVAEIAELRKRRSRNAEEEALLRGPEIVGKRRAGRLDAIPLKELVRQIVLALRKVRLVPDDERLVGNRSALEIRRFEDLRTRENKCADPRLLARVFAKLIAKGVRKGLDVAVQIPLQLRIEFVLARSANDDDVINSTGLNKQGKGGPQKRTGLTALHHRIQEHLATAALKGLYDFGRRCLLLVVYPLDLNQRQKRK